CPGRDQIVSAAVIRFQPPGSCSRIESELSQGGHNPFFADRTTRIAVGRPTSTLADGGAVPSGTTSRVIESIWLSTCASSYPGLATSAVGRERSGNSLGSPCHANLPSPSNMSSKGNPSPCRSGVTSPCWSLSASNRCTFVGDQTA